MENFFELVKAFFQSDYVYFFFASMMPVTELRLALPAAILAGLDPIVSYFICAIGNCLPVPFLILLVRPIFDWMKGSADWIEGKLAKINEKAESGASLSFGARFARKTLQILLKPARLLCKMVHKLETKAHDKADTIKKYEMFGLFVFVAIPLPGTGAWTGSLIAAVLGMRLKDSVPMIILGVFTAGIIMTALPVALQFLIGLF